MTFENSIRSAFVNKNNLVCHNLIFKEVSDFLCKICGFPQYALLRESGRQFYRKGGILTNRVHSRETAAKMNEKPTGDVFETLMNIDAIGNDFVLFGGLGGCGKGGQSHLHVSDGRPHIRIKDVTIGGR
ncbi:MAG: hypothetical protein K8F52_11780 [Candidatus Scalindua rubra]|nr:hypothetical protein [Candidatus Scalindua rubra]